MTTMTYTGQVKTMICWCGIRFGAPAELADKAWNHGYTIYCPLGHTCTWGDTEADREREKRERAEFRLTAVRDQLQASEKRVEAQRRRVSAMKGVVTKTKQRAAKGMCPVPGCRRHFANVRAHVTRQHPEFEGEITTDA